MKKETKKYIQECAKVELDIFSQILKIWNEKKASIEEVLIFKKYLDMYCKNIKNAFPTDYKDSQKNIQYLKFTIKTDIKKIKKEGKNEK